MSEDNDQFDDELADDLVDDLDVIDELSDEDLKESGSISIIDLNSYDSINDTLNRKIPNEQRKMRKKLNKYEKARIIGARAKEINMGVPPKITVPPNVTDVQTIAEMELNTRKIPLIIRRYQNDGYYEDWALSELIF